MLQSIRDKATGWIAWVIIILISIPFALWGIQEYLSPDPTVPVATVNGSEINLQQFQHAYQQQRQRLQNTFGSSFDISQLDEERLKQQTLDRLVNEEVVIQAGLGSGLRVSDQHLAQAIHTQSAFQQEGGFSRPLYDQWLRAQGYSPGMFEYEFRRALLNEQLISAIVDAALVTQHDVGSALGLVSQKRSFSELVFPASDYLDVDVSEAEVERYYDENKDNLVTQERVKLSYVELSRDSLAKDIQISDDELRSLYESQRGNFVTPEQRRASHILISVAQDADEATVESARKRAEDLRAQILDGTSFEEVAKEHSEDPGSASVGGDLGFFGRNVMDKGFEDAVFSMQLDEVSEPVRSTFGFHVIKLTEVKAGETKAFEAVRDQLLRDAQQRRAEQIYFERAERLATLAFERPDTLAPVAEELDLPVMETGELERTPAPDGGLGAEPKVIDAAFSPEVLGQGLNSEPVELDGGRIVVVRIKEHQPARQRSLEETRESIVETLRDRAARERAESSGKAMLARLRAGEAMDEIAKAAAREWVAREDKPRTAKDVDARVLGAAFRMPRPATQDDVVFDGVTTGTGDFVIIALSRVADGEASALAGQSPEATRAALAREYGQSTYDAFVSALRNKAKVSLRKENL